jgi:hypothetical protein
VIDVTLFRSLVGEILYPMSFDGQDNRAPGQGRRKSKNPDSMAAARNGVLYEGNMRPTHHMTSTEEMAMYAKTINVDDSSQRTYVRYCEDSTEPEVYIEEKCEHAVYDFEKSLQALSVDYEDVSGMEELAASSHISDIIVSGQYEGMQQGESAVMATALASSTLVFVEPHLQVEEPDVLPIPPNQDTLSTGLPKTTPFKYTSMSLPSNSSRSSSFSEYNTLLVTPNKADLLMAPDERVPALQKEQSLIHKRTSTKYSVELSEVSRNKIDDIWNANTNFSQVGLEEAIQSNLNKYLYSQHIYGQEVDPERLAKR